MNGWIGLGLGYEIGLQGMIGWMEGNTIDIFECLDALHGLSPVVGQVRRSFPPRPARFFHPF